MTKEKWNLIVLNLKEKFEILEQGENELEHNGKAEYFVFISPLGKLKLERTIKPKFLGKKTAYSQRAGCSVDVEYVFSETEFVDKINVYIWDEIQDEWNEFDEEKSKQILS